MGRTADVVIIGGGIHGCAIAYYLVQHGWKNIVLLEKQYLGAGGTGRCAAGFRHQFGTEINIRLAAASINKLRNLEQELVYGESLELTQNGYLMLAYAESQLDQFKRNTELQKSIDPQNSSVMLDPSEIEKMVPYLNMDGVVGASFNPEDGHINPFHTTYAYATAARNGGAQLYNDTGVADVITQRGRVIGVMTDKGHRINTPVVVNVAGADGKAIGQMAGVEIPIIPECHQLLVTEPVETILEPTVISFAHGTCFKQTPRGQFIMGSSSRPKEVESENLSFAFMSDVAREITYHMPVLEQLNIIRQWAGLYDNTPDCQGIVGRTEVEGFYLDLGWSGHGFQLAPAVGQAMAEIISGDKPFIDVDCLLLERFKHGALIPEPYCV